MPADKDVMKSFILMWGPSDFNHPNTISNTIKPMKYGVAYNTEKS